MAFHESRHTGVVVGLQCLFVLTFRADNRFAPQPFCIILINHDRSCAPYRTDIHCPNCQATYAPGTYFCPNGGQNTHSHRMPIRYFIMEFLEGTPHLPGRFGENGF